MADQQVMVITPRLWSFLLLQVTVHVRDEEATRQALRMTAEELSDEDAMRTVRLLERNIPATARRWLEGLVG